MFNSVEATDEYELDDCEDIELAELCNKELKKYFLPSQFCLITSYGNKYGPFGTDTLGRKPVTIQIGNGDVLAQATSSFIYVCGRETFKNDNCFSFYVSNEIKNQEVADVCWARTIEIQQGMI